MAAPTASDIVAVGLRLSRGDPELTDDADEGLGHLNDCYMSLLTEEVDWDFMRSTGQINLVAGEQVYDIDAALAAVLDVPAVERFLRITNDTVGGPPLRGVDWATFERETVTSTDDPSGTPVFYTQIGLGGPSPTIRFGPTPDMAYTLGVLVKELPIRLVGSDVPRIPEVFARPLLSAYVAARMWEQKGGAEAMQHAMRHETRYQEQRSKLIAAYGSARETDTVFAESSTFIGPNDGAWM